MNQCLHNHHAYDFEILVHNSESLTSVLPIECKQEQ